MESLRLGGVGSRPLVYSGSNVVRRCTDHILPVVLACIVKAWGPAHLSTQAVDVVRHHTEHIIQAVAVVLACVMKGLGPVH
jgi:hypothetical protein